MTRKKKKNIKKHKTKKRIQKKTRAKPKTRKQAQKKDPWDMDIDMKGFKL